MGETLDWLDVGFGAGAIVLAIIFFWRGERGKALEYVILSNRPLVALQSKFPLEVLYNGTKVDHPRLVVWRVANTGSKPIANDDYERDICLTVTGATILSSELTRARPTSLDPLISQAGLGQVHVERRLLNPNDMIEVQMLVDGDPTELRVEARISGISTVSHVRIPQTSWGEPWRYSKFDYSLLALVTAILAAGAIYMLTQEPGSKILGAIVLVLLVVGGPYRFWRSARRNRVFLGK